MALGACRECGHQVSSEAQTCPGCGCTAPYVLCRECGHQVSDEAKPCPSCGCRSPHLTDPQDAATQAVMDQSEVAPAQKQDSAPASQGTQNSASRPLADFMTPKKKDQEIRVTKKHQNALQSLVICLAVVDVIGVISFMSSSYPEEISAAVTKMDELALEAPPSEIAWEFGLSLVGLGVLVVFYWSLWQLYCLNQKGFVKLFWSEVILTVVGLFLSGSWYSSFGQALLGLHYLALGAIFYIGYLSNAYDFAAADTNSNQADEPMAQEI